MTTEGLERLIELCAKGSFYTDYDESTEVLAKAVANLHELPVRWQTIARIGSNWSKTTLATCFVCGAHRSSQEYPRRKSNNALYVPTRNLHLTDWFPAGSATWLASLPEDVLVVGACDLHLPQLQTLEAQWYITPVMIAELRASAPAVPPWKNATFACEDCGFGYDIDINSGGGRAANHSTGHDYEHSADLDADHDPHSSDEYPGGIGR